MIAVFKMSQTSEGGKVIFRKQLENPVQENKSSDKLIYT